MLDLCIRDLVRIVGGQLSLGSMPPLGGEFEPIGRIVVNCDEVEPGDVFWELPGSPQADSQFAEEAFMRSASGAVVSGRHVEPWAGKFSIRVKDTSEALWQLARWVRCRYMGQVIAVAGDENRSKTSRMLRQTLDHLGRVPHESHGFSSSFRCEPLHVGREQERVRESESKHEAPVCPPLSMLDWDEQDEYAIVEIHGDSEYEIDEISHLCCPHIAAITCNHNSILNYQKDSNGFETYVSDVLSSLPNDGWAILNGDDAQLHRLVDDGPTATMWFGRNADCDIAAKQIHCDEKGLSFQVAQQRYFVPECGEQHLLPALITIAVGRVLDWTDSQIATGLTRYQKKTRAICW